MRLIQNYWFISITIFCKTLQEFFLLKLLILSKIQKTDLTNLILQLLIISLSLNRAVANSAFNFQNRLIKLYFTKLIIQDENSQYSNFLNSFSLVHSIGMICKLELYIENHIQYFGSFFELIHWNIIYHCWSNC